VLGNKTEGGRENSLLAPGDADRETEKLVGGRKQLTCLENTLIETDRDGEKTWVRAHHRGYGDAIKKIEEARV